MDIDDVNGACISTAANRMSGGHVNNVKVLVCKDTLLGALFEEALQAAISRRNQC